MLLNGQFYTHNVKLGMMRRKGKKRRQKRMTFYKRSSARSMCQVSHEDAHMGDAVFWHSSTVQLVRLQIHITVKLRFSSHTCYSIHVIYSTLQERCYYIVDHAASHNNNHIMVKRIWRKFKVSVFFCQNVTDILAHFHFHNLSYDFWFAMDMIPNKPEWKRLIKGQHQRPSLRSTKHRVSNKALVIFASMETTAALGRTVYPQQHHWKKKRKKWSS